MIRKRSKVVIIFSLEQEIDRVEQAEELKGSLASSDDEDKLMHSVLEGDKDKVDQGEIIEEATNRNIGSFTPDMAYQQLVSNYRMAEEIIGPKLIRMLTGFDESYVSKNVHIPEFQREMKKNIEESVSKMKKEKLLDRSGGITEKGYNLAAVVAYVKELEHIMPKGLFGERSSKEISHYGAVREVNPWKKGDRYRDISIRDSVHRALRRGHQKLTPQDLRVKRRERKGRITVIYAIDASASMKGKKIGAAKRAGIALSFRAIHQKDKVGLVVFSKGVSEKVDPTDDFVKLASRIVRVRTSKQTDFANMLDEAARVFAHGTETKHLIILTDALPTTGDAPRGETLEAVGRARASGLTVSIVGIGLDREGGSLARHIVSVGGGRLSVVNDLDRLDTVVLADYDAVDV